MSDNKKLGGQWTAEDRAEWASRYEDAVHAMQSAVAYQQNHSPSDQTPKGLRVGLNNAMADHGALARLLVSKGIITDEEYIKAITEAAEQEAEMAARIARKMGGLPDSVTFA